MRSSIFIAVLISLVFSLTLFLPSISFAASFNPLDALKNSLAPGLPGIQSIGTTAPTLPSLSKLSGLSSSDWKILNTSSLSFDDFGGALKSIAILAINLFLIVIQVIAGILKALLPFLQ